MKLTIKKLIILFAISILNLSIHSYNSDLLINHVKNSVENASIGKSRLIAPILELDGMSSSKVRHFLNNICFLPGAC